MKLESLSWSELVTRAKEAEAAAARSTDAEIRADGFKSRTAAACRSENHIVGDRPEIAAGE